MERESFEEVEHTADWALRVWGTTLPEFFVNAARGMYSLLGAKRRPDSVVYHPITVEAPDWESLLVAWLNELLYLTESRDEVFDQFDIPAITGTHLQACVAGGTAAGPMMKYIKAATFHNLRIERTDEGFETTIVFDV